MRVPIATVIRSKKEAFSQKIISVFVSDFYENFEKKSSVLYSLAVRKACLFYKSFSIYPLSFRKAYRISTLYYIFTDLKYLNY
jgi:hypothetical protein